MKKENLIIVFILVMAALFFSGTKQPEKIDTQTFVCNTSALAKAYIDSWSKKGYEVQHITSQSVTTSINNNYYYYATHLSYRDLRGDIIIIMTKKTK